MSEPFVYKSRPKGPPSFSGRSQAKMAACLAMHQKVVFGGSQVSKQQKQKGKK